MPKDYFIKLYKKGRIVLPKDEDRHIVYRSTASIIASIGTIEDLRVLDDYFEQESDLIWKRLENELEEMENESITTAI